jgi:hypothetical protein
MHAAIQEDLTGGFPKTSRRGYNYILVLYGYDGNSIQAEPMKNRLDTEGIRAYTKIYDELTVKWVKPRIQMMDNEGSTALKQFLHSKYIYFQLAAPHVNRQNAAERVIKKESKIMLLQTSVPQTNSPHLIYGTG